MKIFKVLILAFFFFIIFTSSVFAQRGCCSRHGGIDYCDTTVGSYVCNDGSYSPTCGCYKAQTPAYPTISQERFNKFLDDFAPYPTETSIPIPTSTPTLIPTSDNIHSFLFDKTIPLTPALFLITAVALASFLLGQYKK